MKRPYPALCQLQSNLMKAIHGKGLCTDESLVAYLVQIGEKPIDPSCVAHWRAGNGSAPLGLLLALLDHVSKPEEVLQMLAGPRLLRVVQAGTIDNDERGLLDRTLEIGAQYGDFLNLVRVALQDGQLTRQERAAMRESLEDKIQGLSTLHALLDDSEDSEPVLTVAK